MSNQIETFNYQQYSTGIEMLAQQMSSNTLDAVTLESKTGKRVSFDQVGAVVMQQKTGRAVDIPIVDTPHARRWLTNSNWYMRDFVDEFDKLDILNDPTNEYSQAFAAAAARRTDKIVIDAALGTVYTGEEGVTPVTLPASQKIAVGGTGFTLAKLQLAVKKLKGANAIMPGDSIHCFYTSAQELEFINTTEVKSSDFAEKKVMVDGVLKYFYGVYFHMVEDDEGIGPMIPKAGATRSCPLWLKSGIKLNRRKVPYGRVNWIDERESWQVMAGMSAGAVRMQEKKVVQIDVNEP